MNMLTNRKTMIVAIVLTLVTVGFAVTPLIPIAINKPAAPVLVQDIMSVQKDTLPALNEENLMAEIKKQNIICEKHVLAQAKLESNNMASVICQKANNLFGMRYPGRRPTTAIGVYLPQEQKIVYGSRKELRKYLKKPTYAVYANWVDAVKDYKMWQDNAFKVEEKYLSFLTRIYAEAPDYVDVVDKMAKNIED